MKTHGAHTQACTEQNTHSYLHANMGTHLHVCKLISYIHVYVQLQQIRTYYIAHMNMHRDTCTNTTNTHAWRYTCVHISYMCILCITYMKTDTNMHKYHKYARTIWPMLIHIDTCMYKYHRLHTYYLTYMKMGRHIHLEIPHIWTHMHDITYMDTHTHAWTNTRNVCTHIQKHTWACRYTDACKYNTCSWKHASILIHACTHTYTHATCLCSRYECTQLNTHAYAHTCVLWGRYEDPSSGWALTQVQPWDSTCISATF